MGASNMVYLARAIPIEPAFLAAALTSYIETKAACTTFLLCAKHANSSATALGRLPPEMLHQVADVHRETANDEALSEWVSGLECATGQCVPHDHLASEEIETKKQEAREAFEIPDDTSIDSTTDDFHDFLMDRAQGREVWQNEHWIRAVKYRGEIEDETSKLSRYRNVSGVSRPRHCFC